MKPVVSAFAVCLLILASKGSAADPDPVFKVGDCQAGDPMCAAVPVEPPPPAPVAAPVVAAPAPAKAQTPAAPSAAEYGKIKKEHVAVAPAPKPANVTYEFSDADPVAGKTLVPRDIIFVDPRSFPREKVLLPPAMECLITGRFCDSVLRRDEIPLPSKTYSLSISPRTDSSPAGRAYGGQITAGFERYGLLNTLVETVEGRLYATPIEKRTPWNRRYALSLVAGKAGDQLIGGATFDTHHRGYIGTTLDAQARRTSYEGSAEAGVVLPFLGGKGVLRAQAGPGISRDREHQEAKTRLGVHGRLVAELNLESHVAVLASLQGIANGITSPEKEKIVRGSVSLRMGTTRDKVTGLQFYVQPEAIVEAKKRIPDDASFQTTDVTGMIHVGVAGNTY